MCVYLYEVVQPWNWHQVELLYNNISFVVCRYYYHPSGIHMRDFHNAPRQYWLIFGLFREMVCLLFKQHWRTTLRPFLRNTTGILKVYVVYLTLLMWKKCFLYLNFFEEKFAYLKVQREKCRCEGECIREKFLTTWKIIMTNLLFKLREKRRLYFQYLLHKMLKKNWIYFSLSLSLRGRFRNNSFLGIVRSTKNKHCVALLVCHSCNTYCKVYTFRYHFL